MSAPLAAALYTWLVLGLLIFSFPATMASSSNDTSRIVELAAQISSSVTKLQEQLSAQGAPSPSFAEDGPEGLPDNVSDLKDAVLDATAELHEILLDPLLLLFKFASIENLVSIDAVCRYHIPEMIPPGGTISFDEIAEKTGLEKPNVRRILRHAMNMHILREPEPEIVAHTSVSKFLTKPEINGWVEFEGRDTWPAITRIVDAVQKWPNSQESNETGFVLANDGKTIPEVVSSDPVRAMRFAAGMQAIDYVPGYAVNLVPTVYDWASLGNATIVNVGGSRGQAAIELAKSFGNLNFVVQDAAATIQGANASIPSKLQSRIEFMEHALFAPQTVEAPVYFFRMALRGLGDKYAVQVLKAQVPVLKPGVKILIQEVVMPEPHVIPLWRERVSRSVDLALESFSNGRERYLDEWKALFAAADERFVLKQVFVPKDNLLGILEVHWDA